MTHPSLYKRSELAAKRYVATWRAHSDEYGRTMARLDYAAGYRAGFMAARRVKK